MGVVPGALNNARIHRVLEALDEASERLQEELARWVHARVGAGAASALEFTGTFFAGHRGALVEWVGQCRAVPLG